MNIFTGINMLLYWLKESIGLFFYLSGIVFFVTSWFCVGVNYYITLKSGSYVTTVSTQNLL